MSRKANELPSVQTLYHGSFPWHEPRHECTSTADRGSAPRAYSLPFLFFCGAGSSFRWASFLHYITTAPISTFELRARPATLSRTSRMYGCVLLCLLWICKAANKFTPSSIRGEGLGLQRQPFPLKWAITPLNGVVKLYTTVLCFA